MKKLVLAATMLMFGATTVFAQDLTSRKGENYLPEEGDWAIGMDAVPFLNYVGNFFGKTGPNNANGIWGPVNSNLALTGKYFLTEGKAIRVGLRLGVGSNSFETNVTDLSATSNNWPSVNTVANKMKTSYTQFGLNGGLEWRKGHTRLQGFYGAELGFMAGAHSQNYTYGNALNVSKGIGVTTQDDFDNGNIVSTVDGNGNTIDARMTSFKSGTDFSLGLRGFVGAEYFVLPKLSVGGELGWGLGMNFGGQSTATFEAIGERAGQTATVETMTINGTKGSNVGVDGSLINPLFGPAGRLNITFHF